MSNDIDPAEAQRIQDNLQRIAKEKEVADRIAREQQQGNNGSR